MSKAFLRANAEVFIGGERYFLERQCSDGVWVLRHMHTGRQLEQSTEQILEAYCAGTARFASKETQNVSLTGRRTEQPAQTVVSKTELDAAKTRMTYVRAVLDVPCSRRSFEKCIEEVWISLDRRPARKPSWGSVYRWLRAYIASGRQPSTLIAAHCGKGVRRHDKLTP